MFGSSGILITQGSGACVFRVGSCWKKGQGVSSVRKGVTGKVMKDKHRSYRINKLKSKLRRLKFEKMIKKADSRAEKLTGKGF